MSEESDKQKKLKEIQDRLAEIQGKPASKAESPKVEKKPKAAESKEIPAQKEATPKAPPPKVEKKDAPVTSPEKSAPKKAESLKAVKKDDSSWNQNKVKTEAQKQGSDKKEKAIVAKAGRTKFKILSIISISITLLVAAYIIYEYILKPSGEEVVEAVVPLNETDMGGENGTLPEDQASASEAINDVEEEQPVEKESEMLEVTTDSKQTEREKEVESPAERPSAVTMGQSSPPSGFIISFSSNANADAASKNAQMLMNKGFKAGYYYMPDKNASGPALYKVFVGPYSSESEAFPDFKKVIKLNDKAFILKMD